MGMEGCSRVLPPLLSAPPLVLGTGPRGYRAGLESSISAQASLRSIQKVKDEGFPRFHGWLALLICGRGWRLIGLPLQRRSERKNTTIHRIWRQRPRRRERKKKKESNETTGPM